MSPNNIDDLQLEGFGLERWPGLHWNSGRFSTGIGGCIGLEYAAAVLHKLQALPPRTLGLALRRALGSAARAERTCVTVEDLPTKLAPVRRGIGFTAAQSD